MEWAAELDLRLLNEGSKSTCVRWQGESIVDLTWTSLSAARKTKSWEVAVDLESLSDHRYIFMTLLPGGGETSRDNFDRRRVRDEGRRQEDFPRPR